MVAKIIPSYFFHNIFPCFLPSKVTDEWKYDTGITMKGEEFQSVNSLPLTHDPRHLHPPPQRTFKMAYACMVDRSQGFVFFVLEKKVV